MIVKRELVSVHCSDLGNCWKILVIFIMRPEMCIFSKKFRVNLGVLIKHVQVSLVQEVPDLMIRFALAVLLLALFGVAFGN